MWKIWKKIFERLGNGDIEDGVLKFIVIIAFIVTTGFLAGMLYYLLEVAR